MGEPMKRQQFEELPAEVRDTLEMAGIPGQDPIECMESLQQISDSYPGYVPARLNLAAMYLEVDGPAAAEKAYRSVLSDFPDEVGAFAGLATVFEARKDHLRAEEFARKAIENGYNWAPCHSVIARCREAAGDVQGACEAYLRSYRMSPHAWKNLEDFCRLTKRAYVAPLHEAPQPITNDQLSSLFTYIDEAANSPWDDGTCLGCDHTLRFSTLWAEKNGIDVIELYQFLNSRGGFCDCEVCYNVEQSILDNEDVERV